METKTLVGQPTQKKLGFTAAAKIIAPTMSGCGKTFDNDCGIREKMG